MKALSGGMVAMFLLATCTPGILPIPQDPDVKSLVSRVSHGGESIELIVQVRNPGPTDVWAPRKISAGHFELSRDDLVVTVVTTGPALEVEHWSRLQPGEVSQFTITLPVPAVRGRYDLSSVLIAEPSDACRRLLDVSGLRVIDRITCRFGRIRLGTGPAPIGTGQWSEFASVAE